MKLLLTLLLTLLFAVSLSIVQAQPGTLDKSYGNGGWIYNAGAKMFIQSSAVQADNKLIVGGNNLAAPQVTYRLIRYNTDGTLDTSFGYQGVASTVLSYYDQPSNGWSSVKVQPDGKIIAAGYAYVFAEDNYPPYNADIILARFNPDGTPDASFGNNGSVITDFGEYETAEAMALEPDGKIVLAGIYSLRGIGYDTEFLTVRYNPDGSLDSSFNSKGYAVFSGFNTGADNAYAVIVQEDGKIVVGGNYEINRYFMLIRYNVDGSPDNSFGTNGFVNTKIITDGEPTDESINSLVIDKEQRIIAAGTCLDVSMAVARYKPDGTLDSSFNGNGKQVVQVGAAFTEAKTVLLLKDERILLAGDTYGNENETQDLALACLKPDGSLDSTFGTNGITRTDFGGDETCNNAVLQTDGKILLTGDYEPSGSAYSLIARYNGYDPNKQPLAVRIKRWLQHHGFFYQLPNNTDVRYYAVQRSADGITFKEIARIANTGTQQGNNFEDVLPLSADNYYRLAAIEKDGSRVYSNTVLVDETVSIRLFPNPVKDNLVVNGLPATGKTMVSVVDLAGNVRSTTVASGSNCTINTSALHTGSYLLRVQHKGNSTTLPFVKE